MADQDRVAIAAGIVGRIVARLVATGGGDLVLGVEVGAGHDGPLGGTTEKWSQRAEGQFRGQLSARSMHCASAHCVP